MEAEVAAVSILPFNEYRINLLSAVLNVRLLPPSRQNTRCRLIVVFLCKTSIYANTLEFRSNDETHLDCTI